LTTGRWQFLEARAGSVAGPTQSGNL